MQWSEQLGVFLWGTTPLTSLLLSLCTLTDGPEVWGPFRPRRCRGGALQRGPEAAEGSE